MISAMSAIRLPQVVPSAFPMEMLLTARTLRAEEALRTGLINTVVEDVQAEAESWASSIAKHPPVAVQATKRLALFPVGRSSHPNGPRSRQFVRGLRQKTTIGRRQRRSRQVATAEARCIGTVSTSVL